MKKKDIITLSAIAIVSLVASYLILSSIFDQDKGASVEIKVVDVIKSDLTEPSQTVFHKDSINPAVQVFIGVEGNSASSNDGTAN